MTSSNIKFIFFLLSAIVVFDSCQSKKKSNIYADWNHIDESNEFLSNVIIEDIFTPPVASRIIVYSNLAAYESLAALNDTISTLNGKLNDFHVENSVEEFSNVNPSIASFIAFHTVARELVFSKDLVLKHLDSLKQDFETNFDQNVIEESYAFGESIASQVINYSKSDGYHERTGLTRYSYDNDPGKWKATPPDYMDGIEPNWHTLRPLVLDSVSQFRPAPPTKFDSTKNSEFYKEALHVYKTQNSLNDEQVEIAKFWDCNPNISYRKGHMMFYNQKISPGGHWISISNIVTQMKGLDIYESSKVLTLVSISLYDAFLSCWEVKYVTSLIRPITYINRYIDSNWNSLLQTPAFPEYTSGHSVISTAAATVLTSLLGDNVYFEDTTEVSFGLPVRTFESFLDASNEAAISRLYGGIHYMPAISNGVKQGDKVGKLVVSRLIKK